MLGTDVLLTPVVGSPLLWLLQVYNQVGSEPQQRLSDALAKAGAAAADAEAARLAAAAAAAAPTAAGGGSSSQPVAQLEAAAAAEVATAAAAAAREEAAAIQAALGGMVWTRSLKRLYTLVDRWGAGLCAAGWWGPCTPLLDIPPPYTLIPAITALHNRAGIAWRCHTLVCLCCVPHPLHPLTVCVWPPAGACAARSRCC